MSDRRALVPFAVFSAGYFAHVGFINPYLPLWLQGMGLNLLAIGLLGALQPATRLFAPYAWGWLSDHTGHRVWLLRYCAFTAGLASLLLWMELPLWGLALALLLMFVHTSAMIPLSETVLAQVVSHEGRLDMRRYGRVRLWGSAGFLVTVLLAGAWFEQRGLSAFPLWVSGTLLAVVASTWTLNDRREPRPADHVRLRVWPVLRQPAVAWFFLSVLLHVLAHIFVYSFFSLYLDRLGYSKTVIGLLWAASVVVEIAWFYTQGRWMGRLPLHGWLQLAAALAVLRMALTAGAAQWLWVLFVAQALHAVTFAAHHSACIAFVQNHFPGDLRGRGQALYAVLGYGVSGVLGGVVGGWLSQQLGLSAVFWLATTVAAAAVWAVRQAAHADARQTQQA